MNMGNFFKAFCDIFFGGMLGIIYADPETLGNRGGVIGSLVQMFDFKAYAEAYNLYKPDMTTGQVAGAFICFICFCKGTAYQAESDNTDFHTSPSPYSA